MNTHEAEKGEPAAHFITRMIELAAKTNQRQFGKHNDIEMTFYVGSHLYDKCTEYDLRVQLAMKK